MCSDAVLGHRNDDGDNFGGRSSRALAGDGYGARLSKGEVGKRRRAHGDRVGRVSELGEVPEWSGRREGSLRPKDEEELGVVTWGCSTSRASTERSMAMRRRPWTRWRGEEVDVATAPTGGDNGRARWCSGERDIGEGRERSE